jgi:hypothetical protein
MKNAENRIFKTLVNQFYKDGLLVDDDLKNRESFVKKMESIIEGIDKSPRLMVIIDHRDTMIKQAEKFYSDGDFEFGKIFYATYFEHTLNYLIDHVAQKKELDSKTRKEIIQSVQIRGKTSWLLKLLELKPLNKNHLKTINDLSEQRNSFVHFKWNDFEDVDSDAEDSKTKNLNFKKKLNQRSNI